MLKPGQIPAVVSAYFRGAPQAMTTEEALCAAINAWPNAVFATEANTAPCIYLPLPQEKTND